MAIEKIERVWPEKHPITVKLTDETIEDITDHCLILGIRGISPFLETVIKDYLSKNPLTQKEKDAVKILKAAIEKRRNNPKSL
jgi:hypothetical protein